jgi:hypothetical protein
MRLMAVGVAMLSGCILHIPLDGLDKSERWPTPRPDTETPRLARLACLTRLSAEVTSDAATVRRTRDTLVAVAQLVTAGTATLNAAFGGNETTTKVTAGSAAFISAVAVVRALIDDKFEALIKDQGVIETYLRVGPVGAGDSDTPANVTAAEQSLTNTLNNFYGGNFSARVLLNCVNYLTVEQRQ